MRRILTGIALSGTSAIMLAIGACGAGEQDTSADPAVRQERVIELASEYAEPRLPDPHKDLAPPNVIEESLVDGRARVNFVGYFEESGQWLEKEASVYLELYEGKWHISRMTDFSLTAAEMERQTEIQRQKVKQKRVDELNGILEAFGSVKATHSEFEKFPRTAPVLEPGTQYFPGLRFNVIIHNPTSRPHKIEYKVSWTGETFDIVDSQCHPFNPSRFRWDDSITNSVEVQALGMVDQQESHEYSKGYCTDWTVSTSEIQITEIDGFADTRQVQDAMSAAQASP